jgi:hypothetical protein
MTQGRKEPPERGPFWRMAGVYLCRSEAAECAAVRLSYARLAARCRQLAEAQDLAEAASLGLSTTQFVSDEETGEIAGPCA